jgi:hypothetical protein
MRRLIEIGLSVAAEEVLEEVDRWRSLEPDNPSRGSAICCLILMGAAAAAQERKQGGSNT